MRYTKPILMELGTASVEIQGVGHKGMIADDAAPNQTQQSTGGCYDLDGE